MSTGRKITGGKYHQRRKKRFHEKNNQEKTAVIGEIKKKSIRGRGGNKRQILLRSDTANVKTDGKIQKTEIKNVLETPQNSFLARQNRLLKGAIIETALGKAQITNRPSQEGQVNAILIKE